VNDMCAAIDASNGVERVATDAAEKEPVLRDLVWSSLRTGNADILARASALYARILAGDEPETES